MNGGEINNNIKKRTGTLELFNPEVVTKFAVILLSCNTIPCKDRKNNN